MFTPVALAAALIAAGPAPLTTDERVRALRTVEEVRSSYRDSARRELDTPAITAALRRRLLDLARGTVALERLGEPSITAEDLDRELARMKRQTRMPARLRELFAALGNDARLIKETLVRPALLERRLRERYERAEAPRLPFDSWLAELARGGDASSLTTVATGAGEGTSLDADNPSCAPGDGWDSGSLDDFFGSSGETAVWTGSEVILWNGDGGARYDPATDSWATISAGDAPAFRTQSKAVWTGTEMVIWGGQNFQFVGYVGVGTGGRYDPLLDRWTPLPQAPIPGVFDHSMIWTGTEVIVFGGRTQLSNTFSNQGARYNPATNTWTKTANSSQRAGHAAVWTGNRMIVYGGFGDTLNWYRTDGARYDPATNTWSTMAAGPTGSDRDLAVWTGTVMVLWSTSPSRPASRYNPTTNSWSPVTTVSAPTHSGVQSIAWTGSRMIVWTPPDGRLYDPVSDVWTPMSQDGAPSGAYRTTWMGDRFFAYGGPAVGGGRYDPTTDSWTPVAAEPYPDGPADRNDAAAVWTGAEMLVWGGATRTTPVDSIPWRYDPVLDTWSAGSTAGAPAAFATKAVWTGSQMLVWNDGTQAGARYDPVTDAWALMATVGAPSPRNGAVHVWTGTELIVWGGAGVNTGGRYAPATDTWSAMSNSGAPTNNPPGLWIGDSMFVWGSLNAPVPAGARYFPPSDTWTPVSTVGAPSARYDHALVWTGQDVLVLGGNAGSGSMPTGDFGRRYDPATDVWKPTSTSGQPAVQARASAVWTGGQVLFWGGEYPAGATSVPAKTGGRYVPGTDTWLPMDRWHGPTSRSHHATVFTGTQMIVWGPDRNGGRYGLGGFPDVDADGIDDCTDLCPKNADPAQSDVDADGLGDACDPCPDDALNDPDVDGVCNGVDNCPAVANPSQANADQDALGDACDPCPDDALNDPDVDGVCNSVDNCPAVANPSQANADQDALGDACDPCPSDASNSDPDADAVCGAADNCPFAANPTQADLDADGSGDACDGCPLDAANDADADGVCGNVDLCPGTFNHAQRDADGDGRGDLCDVCPSVADSAQADGDGDGVGDACDCQPDDPNDSAPPDPVLSIAKNPDGSAHLAWAAAAAPDAYSITRGTLAGLAPDQYGPCMNPGVFGTSFDDAVDPSPGSGFTYLVRGQNFDCGLGSLGRTSSEAERSNADPAACSGLAHTDARATSETPVFGTVSGTFAATQSSNDVAEAITEVLSSGGNPSLRFSQLEHRWALTVTPGSRVEFHVEAWRTTSPDGDDFRFEYAVGGGAFTPITLTSLPLVDEDRDRVVSLPASVVGSVVIRVVDTVRTAGTQALDTVRVDDLFVRTVP